MREAYDTLETLAEHKDQTCREILENEISILNDLQTIERESLIQRQINQWQPESFDQDQHEGFHEGEWADDYFLSGFVNASPKSSFFELLTR